MAALIKKFKTTGGLHDKQLNQDIFFSSAFHTCNKYFINPFLHHFCGRTQCPLDFYFSKIQHIYCTWYSNYMYMVVQIFSPWKRGRLGVKSHLAS